MYPLGAVTALCDPRTSKAWVGSGGGFLFMVTSSRIPSLWDISRGVPDIPMHCAVSSHTRHPVEYPALSFSLSVSSPLCVLHSRSRCRHISAEKAHMHTCSFQKGAQYIAAGTYHFHATGLITNVYEREPVSVTGSNHNKRAQVSEELVRGVTNLLKVCQTLQKKNASGLKSKPPLLTLQ